MKYSKGDLRLMAIQVLKADITKDSRYVVLVSRVSGKTRIPPSEVKRKIIDLAAQ